MAQHSSRPRNRNIANAFFKAGFIDAWGRGYKKIREGFEAAGLPMPKVENFCGGVRVTFQRNNVSVSEKRRNVTKGDLKAVGGLSVVKLTDRQKNIRELILKDSFISTQEMSEVLSVVKRTVERDLADMRKKKVLIREGNTSAGHWIVIDNQNS